MNDWATDSFNEAIDTLTNNPPLHTTYHLRYIAGPFYLECLVATVLKDSNTSVVSNHWHRIYRNFHKYRVPGESSPLPDTLECYLLQQYFRLSHVPVCVVHANAFCVWT